MIKLSEDRREFEVVSRFLYLIIKPRPRPCSKSGIPNSSCASLRSIQIFFLFKHLACYVPFHSVPSSFGEPPPPQRRNLRRMFEDIATCNTCLFSRCSFTLRQRKKNRPFVSRERFIRKFFDHIMNTFKRRRGLVHFFFFSKLG